MIEAYAHPKNGNLHPADPDSAEKMAALKGPVLVKITETRERSLQQHRMYRALLRIAADNAPRPTTPDGVAFALKIMLGFCDWVYFQGKMHAHPKSTAFDKMGQSQFQHYFDLAITHALAEFLPGLTEQALRKQIEEEAR